MRRKCFAGCCLVLLLVLIAGCTKAPDKSAGVSASKPLSVYVVNYPLKYFAEWIGGEWVNVKFPAPADGDPAYWSPGPEVVAAYQQADLILLNGADYAKWISKASMPSSKMVDTSGAFSDRPSISRTGRHTPTARPGNMPTAAWPSRHGSIRHSRWSRPEL